MRPNTTKGSATIVSAYSRTLAASTEEKDVFYGKLSDQNISQDQKKFSYLVTSMQEWVMIAHHGLQSLDLLKCER